MKRTCRTLLTVFLGSLLLSCNDDTVSPPPPPDLSTPEAIVEQLQVAYRERDIEAYADLLAPEFRFYFQPQDADAIGEESWTANQDSIGTGALFATREVSAIRIALGHGAATDPTESGFDPDVKKIRLNSVQLEVDLVDGVTLLVADLQDMYFRPGREANGEDPDRWYLLEWRDLPSTVRVLKSPGVELTWGSIKSLFN